LAEAELTRLNLICQSNLGEKRKLEREGRMERALAALRVGEEEAEAVEALPVRAHRAGEDASFYEGFAVRGIRVDRIQPGFLCCSFTVPPRLTVHTALGSWVQFN
jgi:hypothetical protein